MVTSDDLEGDREAVGGEAAGDAGSGLSREVEWEGEGQSVKDGWRRIAFVLRGPVVDIPGSERHLRCQKKIAFFEEPKSLDVEAGAGDADIFSVMIFPG